MRKYQHQRAATEFQDDGGYSSGGVLNETIMTRRRFLGRVGRWGAALTMFGLGAETFMQSLSNRSIIPSALAASGVSSSNLLFASNFGGDVQFGLPSCGGGTACSQNIVGTCADTGMNFSPFTIPGSGNTISPRVSLITGVSGTNSTNVYDYHVNEVKTTIGPYGNNTRAANFKIIQNTKGSNQNVFGYAYDNSTAGTEQLYFRYWVKLEANLKEALNGTWMSFWGFKSSTDLRLSCQLLTQSNGTPYWYMQLDNQEDANKNGVPYVRYIRLSNYDIPVPLGEWMLVEGFYSRIGDGRLWWAVNGTVLFDVVPGSNIIIGRSGHRLNRGTFHSIRAATPNTRDVWLDEIEVWDNFPPDGKNRLAPPQFPGNIEVTESRRFGHTV